MVVILKKNSTNQDNLDIDQLNVESQLIIPNLSTAQRDAQTLETGSIIWNTSTNEYQILDEAGTWEVVAITSAGSGFVTIAGNETITGLKTFANNVIVSGGNDINLNDPSSAVQINSQDALTASSVLPNAAESTMGSNNNFRLSSTGLKLGENVNGTSVLHIKESNPIVNLESLAGGTSTLLLNGQTNNIIDFASVADLHWTTGSQRIDVRNGSSSAFIGFDFINNNLSVGQGAVNLPNALINMNDATNTKYLNLPRVTNATEGSLPLSSDYYGGIYFQEDTGEVRANINGTLYDLLHQGSTDITETNISGITSQPVGINDTQTLTNKTHADAQFTLAAAPAHNEGLLFYDQNEHTMAIYNDNSAVTHQLGQEGLIRVFNNTSVQINNGAVCYVSGTEGVEHRPTIALARADNLTTAKVLGIATSNIPDASFGYVTYWGLVNDVDTSAFSAGDILYLSDTVAGAFTATQPPLNGNYNVELGYVIRVDASLGRILVEINADLAGQAGEASRLTLSIRKGSVGTLNVGEAVYIVGYDNANSVIECEVADNTSSGTMPALGVVSASATNSITGTVVVTGRLEGLNTNSYNVGDGLYVSTAGAITNVKPNGTALVQRIATVVRKNPSNGIIEVLGASRANDLPQMGAQNHIWIGDANNTPVSTLNSTVNLELNTAQTFTNKTLGDALLYTNNSCLNIGVNTADTSIIGVNNFFIGNGSGGNAVANVNTRCNIFIGPNTADTGLISGAQFNVCIGEQNARILTSGSSNITLGEFCCSGSLTTGNENIIIGTSGSVDNNARSNCIAMGTNAQTAAADNSISFNNQTTPFTSFYTQGVRGVAPAGSDHYVTINSSGQFGSVAIGGGGLVDLNSVQTLSNKSFDTINVNNGHTYQLNNQDTLTFEKLRLNNIDVINVTTGTLESAITTSSLQQIASSNNITTFNDTSIRAEHASGTDPYYMLFRKPGNEHYKILLTTTGLLVRDDTSAIPGTPLLRINGNGVNLEQITDAYRIGGVNKLTNTALDATITSAPGLSLSANASHASPQIIENTGAAAELKFDRDSGTYTAAWRLVTTDMRLNIGGTQRIDIDTVSGSFNLSTGGSIDKIAIGPNQVVTTRKTGWATATGTATRTTFDTTTVTTQGLAERLKALIDDLHATAGHGLIGA